MKIKKKEEEHLHYTTLKDRNPNYYSRNSRLRSINAVFIGIGRIWKTRRSYISKIDVWAHKNAAFSPQNQGLRSLVLASVFPSLRRPSWYIRFQYFRPDIYLTCARVQVQCIFQKLPCLASKKSGFNYPKMGLIKLLLPFCPPCLDYLQERPKHGLDRHFIHKSAGKCDIIMQNCKLITPPHLSFARPEQNKKRKTILQMLLHHFRR